MEIFICVLLLLVGLVLIVKGGDWFVDAASWIAEISGVPTFVIGATIVSVATTLPEILVSSIASSQGSVDLAIGNAVGSVNANVAMIMSISIIFMPAVIKRKDYLPKGIILLTAVSCLWAVSCKGTLQLGFSFLVLAIFVAFIIENLIATKRSQDLQAPSAQEDEPKKSGKRKPGKKETIKYITLFVLGAGGIAGGAMLLSTYGEKLALLLNVPSGIIGVTIIAIGTSLPELTTSIVAIVKKKSELSVGNILGANIIDIALILPICSFISGGSLPVSNQTLVLDFPFCLVACSVAVIPALIFGKFRRWQGILLLAGYIAYVTLLILNTLGVIAIY